jgi:hypothetical protein
MGKVEFLIYLQINLMTFHSGVQIIFLIYLQITLVAFHSGVQIIPWPSFPGDARCYLFIKTKYLTLAERRRKRRNGRNRWKILKNT